MCKKILSMKLLLQIWLLKSCLLPATISLECMDENNNPVDWFIVYKLPKMEHQHKLIIKGVAYTYITSEDSSSWKFSNNSINATNSIIANTLQNLYTIEKNSMYILYNDQPPNRESKPNKGHNKGVIMANSTGGFWLVHSVPHFPVLGKKYLFPRSGAVFGQTFLCISMDLYNLNNVGIQLQYNEPEIYQQNINSNLKYLLPDLAKAANNITIQKAPWYHVIDMTSKRSAQFVTFAKSKKFNKDLYEDLVAPYLETDLFVETWPNGPGRLHSNCSKTYKVNNIKSVFVHPANVSFTTTNDHSKWAVSPPYHPKNWLCIGDINRAEHQKVRGGGTVCLDNKQIATDFKKSVVTIEDCSKIVSNCIT